MKRITYWPCPLLESYCTFEKYTFFLPAWLPARPAVGQSLGRRRGSRCQGASKQSYEPPSVRCDFGSVPSSPEQASEQGVKEKLEDALLGAPWLIPN